MNKAALSKKAFPTSRYLVQPLLTDTVMSQNILERGADFNIALLTEFTSLEKRQQETYNI